MVSTIRINFTLIRELGWCASGYPSQSREFKQVFTPMLVPLNTTSLKFNLHYRPLTAHVRKTANRLICPLLNATFSAPRVDLVYPELPNPAAATCSIIVDSFRALFSVLFMSQPISLADTSSAFNLRSSTCHADISRASMCRSSAIQKGHQL